MAANYIQPGSVLTITPAAAITSGQVIAIENLLGVALVDIPLGGIGEVKTDGVFKVPKAPAVAIPLGAAVFWDISAQVFTVGTPAAGDITGSTLAASAGAAGDETLHVKFTGAPGSITPAG
jgi:predicted RecA/RadA family phage recombinase